MKKMSTNVKMNLTAKNAKSTKKKFNYQTLEIHEKERIRG